MGTVHVFTATPCGGIVPQLFRAAYEDGTLPNGTPFIRLVPGTLVQLTNIQLIALAPHLHTVEDTANNASAK